ncbi:MAG: hypothetical protein GXO85_10520 [Chlorobi bacterium]|nr:hypothetical protein [Chlorobiota bacterium]
MSFDSNNNENTSGIKKYLPIGGLIILTISLMIYFGIDQFSRSSETNQNNLLSDLYSRTLKPIFVNEKLTKEDVLNFALYNNLPIDKKENKILEVKNDSSGNEVIEVRKTEIKGNTDNYSKFVDKMELNGKQKNELDSLLEEFKQNITNTIFSDDHKTLAVDTRIGLLHQVLRTEISDFISRVKAKENVASIFTESTLENFNKVIENERNKSVRNYIFFTPDTVIHSDAEFVRGKSSQPVNKEEPSVFLPVLKVIPESDKNESIAKEENGFSFKIDSNVVKVILTENFLKDLDIENYNELKSVLDSSSNKFEISIGLPSKKGMHISISGSNPDSADEFRYEFNLEDFGNVINNAVDIPSQSSVEDWVEFGAKMGSLAVKLQELELDSLDSVEYK